MSIIMIIFVFDTIRRTDKNSAKAKTITAKITRGSVGVKNKIIDPNKSQQRKAKRISGYERWSGGGVCFIR